MKIHIPTPLRVYAGKQDSVSVNATTVGEALGQLTEEHPDLKKHLYSEDGKLRAFVNVYLNDEDIRYLPAKDSTPVSEADSLSIIPSIAGGAPVMEEATALPELSTAEMARYSRHLILPEVGMEGQQKLKAAKVLCVGTGGLGAPLAFYLAAAGIGTLGLVDFDVVDESNLQRQIIHSTKDVGRPKIDSAADKLSALNPHMKIVKHETMLTSQNALDIIKDYDIVADGTDNFPTRYLVNDACVLSGKPNAYGSIFRFEGQASVFATEEGPCYRCLYPEPPPPGLVPSCAEGGVLGILPGLVGIIQATEVIKLILGKGDPLIGRLLLVDSLGMKFRELKLRKNPECPVCGTNPTVTKLIDYDQFCGIQPAAAPAAVLNGIEQITPTDLKRRLDAKDDVFVLDVREPYEFQIASMGGHLIPLNDLPKRVSELDASREIVVHCKMGGRSQKAAEFLKQNGFTKVQNLAGGINAWSAEIDPTVPKY
ncbi:MAG: molybdopterin-synthase adenylyltransferase MoeB [Acidobacteria bacterium]|nr:molybdopterin-synthase adenylyltransferase MoeB [Acidobacteriota bacterium]MBW4044517.1 molybdopterin-synthase adenylyltransferase MoeB [Acidobacteriota bacterium]